MTRRLALKLDYRCPGFLSNVLAKSNRIYDGVEAETRKSQASFQII